MALGGVFFVVASLLLVTARVLSLNEAPMEEVSLIGVAPAPAPLAPAPHMVINATKECPGVCLARCSKHSRQNVCNRACTTCCMVCKCVPAGTAGNRETCGTCYTGWTTHQNRTNKCP
nr:chloroplast GASA [Lilium davidii var. unicolor]